MKPISLRALSNITCGSSELQRRQFGAITIARLLASIFVTVAISGDANFCHIKYTMLMISAQSPPAVAATIYSYFVNADITLFNLF